MDKHRAGIGSALRAPAAVAALLLSASAGAQNTVENPNFTVDLPPWALYLSSAPDPAGSGSAAWSGSEDAGGAIGSSGAAAVALDAAPSAAHAASGIVQCIAFASPTSVVQANYGARFKIPANDVADGSVDAAVEIRFFTDSSCTDFIPGAGGLQGRAIVAGVPDDAFWYTVGDPSFTPPVGTMAGSAEVRATLRKLGASTNAYAAYFDDVYLSLNGSVPIELESFEVD